MAETLWIIFVILVFVVYTSIMLFSLFWPEHPFASSFNRQWPPIDEDEFMRRCPPGTSRDVALRVRRIISEQLGVPYNQIYPEQDFVNDLGCD